MQCSLHNINNIKNKFTQSILNSTPVVPQFKRNHIIAKGDSGASRHYFKPSDANVLQNISPATDVKVILPDNSELTSTHKGLLPILSNEISQQAKTSTILKNLNSSSLISLGQLCDDDCKVLLTKNKIHVVKNNKIVIQGKRNTNDGLWDIPIEKAPNLPTQHHVDNVNTTHQQKLGVIIRKKQKKVDLIKYLHAACFSPVPSTFVRAIKRNHLTTWPGLTTKLVQTSLQPSMATAKGHLAQERQYLQSTNPPTKEPLQQKYEEEKLHKTNDVCYVITELSHRDLTAYIDLTGRFPFQSSRGNNYILVGYHYDSNAILAEPLKNRTASEITKTWKIINSKYAQAGMQPNTYVLDNEISNELRQAFHKQQVTHKLVPPHTHRRNLAERAIQTFKHHFIAGLASVDPKFPVAEWDRLLPQAILTLNLLRTARINKNLSAHAYLFGEFNFQATPLAPPGTKVLIHTKPSNRKSWGPHGIEGWYIGPAPHHYRCVKCFIPDTRSEVITDTVTFFPQYVPFPTVSMTDFLQQTASDIIHLLKNPTPSPVPTLRAGDATHNALLEIATAIQSINVNNTPPPRVLKKLQTPIPNQVSSMNMPSPRVQKSMQVKKLEKIHHHCTNPYAQHYTMNYKSNAAHQIYKRHQYAKYLYAMHIYDDNGKKQSLEALLNGNDGNIWNRSMSNEIGRLAQGNKYGVKMTDTIDFIYANEVPKNQLVTYAAFTCDYRPLKSETHRIRLVVGGDRLIYDDDAGAPAASLLETKIIINSVISDAHKGARFMSCDLKDFFLATPMQKAEYMRIPWKYIPNNIRAQYNLHDKKTKDGHVYVKIKKGMYGLKQAAILAYDNLVSNLKSHGYKPIPNTLGLWNHETRPTTFCLCVDDFGIKYFSKDDIDHLLNALEQNYVCTKDWTGTHFCGLTLDWQYDKNYCDISMPGYVQQCLKKFQHKPPTKPQFSPHHHNPIIFGQKGQTQYVTKPDTSKMLNKKETKIIQSITGSLLYYARAIDGTILPALNDIASQQASPTEFTKAKCNRLLDYVATYPNTTVRYRASNMKLHIDSDAAYLVMPKARSRIAGYFNFGQPNTTLTQENPNGAVLIECKTLRHVVASAAEAEVGGIFHNAQIALPIRYMLEQLGHKQDPTPIKTDNSTAHNFVYDNINLKKSKSWDMRVYWLRDRENQLQFRTYWKKGVENNADYFTKHHPTVYHKEVRNKYVLDKANQVIQTLSTTKTLFQKLTQNQTSWLRGCVDPPDHVPTKNDVRPCVRGI